MVECLRCRHIGRIAELELIRCGIKPNAPIASFIKRLRCLDELPPWNWRPPTTFN
jgi:hypothetical protein